MKKLKLFFLPLCLLVVFSSCKKHASDSVTATGTITATIDGTPQTFNFGATAHLDNTAGFNTLSIIGIKSASASDSMIIEVTSASPIAAGTYTGANSEADMSYTITAGTLVYQFDGSNQASSTDVVISSISATNVQGTFNGTIELIYGSGPASKTVTNGKFNLTIK